MGHHVVTIQRVLNRSQKIRPGEIDRIYISLVADKYSVYFSWSDLIFPEKKKKKSL